MGKLRAGFGGENKTIVIVSSCHFVTFSKTKTDSGYGMAFVLGLVDLQLHCFIRGGLKHSFPLIFLLLFPSREKV
jgi:hypothetical protein